MLTMNPSGWAGSGSESVCKTGIIIGYEVAGLPSTEKAYIANDGWNQVHWKTLHVKDGIASSWMGDFASADEALDSLRGPTPELAELQA